MPSHPELLDWLATTFVKSGWNAKALQKQILMSATYRQSSLADEQARAADPENIWLGARAGIPDADRARCATRPWPRAACSCVASAGPACIPTSPPAVGVARRRCEVPAVDRRGPVPAQPLHGVEAGRAAAIGDRLRRLRAAHLHRHAAAHEHAAAGADPAQRSAVRRECPRARRAADARWRDPCRSRDARLPAGHHASAVGVRGDQLTRLYETTRAGFAAAPDSAVALLATGERPRDPALDRARAGLVASTSDGPTTSAVTRQLVVTGRNGFYTCSTAPASS